MKKLAVALAVVVLVSVAGDAWGDVRYTVTDLGSTFGGTQSWAYGINSSGQVVGTATTSGDADGHVFLYSGGTITDLSMGGARDINDSGDVVGDGPVGAFLYRGGTRTILGTSGGTGNGASAINASAQVVGTAHLAGDVSTHAFLYSEGTMTDLGTLSGGDSYAWDINDRGEVVGESVFQGKYRAFLYREGTMTDLGTLGGSIAGASAVNARGQIVGWSQISPIAGDVDVIVHAFLWNDGTMTDLGALPDAGRRARSWAFGINPLGQVVGQARISEEGRYDAFLYSDGTMTNLNDLIDPASGWWLGRATAINDRGQIVGYGQNLSLGPLTRGFLLSPIPEPSTLALLVAGGIGLVVSAWRRRSAGRLQG